MRVKAGDLVRIKADDRRRVFRVYGIDPSGAVLTINHLGAVWMARFKPEQLEVIDEASVRTA